jgi:hypothetical protein
MAELRIMLNLRFDHLYGEDILPTTEEYEAIAANLVEHVNGEQQAGIPGFAKVTGVRTKLLDRDVVAEPAA